jgi:hypothetical protein
MIAIQVETNLMTSQVKPAALRIAETLVQHKYDIECAALLGSFLSACGVSSEELTGIQLEVSKRSCAMAAADSDHPVQESNHKVEQA